MSHATDFVSALPPGRSEEATGPLEQILRRIVEEAAAAWPMCHVEPSIYAAYVARRVPSSRPLHQSIQKLAYTDLYLACACEQGDPRALAQFRESYLDPLDAMLARSNIPAGIAADVKTDLSARLFTRCHRDKPLLDGFAGTGSLRAWLRVVVVREALHRLRRATGEVPMEQALADAMAESDSPDIALEKQLYLGQFREAFAIAMNGLSARDRKLLREHYLYGLSIDKIGALYGVHRSSAARWITAAKNAVASATRASMTSSLQLSSSEYDSILRLIGDQIDVSITRFLNTRES